MKFEQLLIATLNNSNEIRNQAECTLNQYKDKNYQHFLFKLSKHILKTNNPVSFYISFTIILQDIRSGKLFLNEELFNQFLPNFQNVLSQIFISGKLNEATCNILSMVLTHISLRIPTTNIIQFLILSINQVPQLQCFFISTLATILFQSENHTPFDVFISILSIPNTSINDYNSKILLLFSIIRHFPKNKDQVHLLLSQFISNIPSESIKYVLHLYSLHIQPLKDFFKECFSETLAFVTNCIITHQKELPIQAEAVDCLTNLSIAFNDSYEVISSVLLIILQMIEVENSQNTEIESVLKESIHIMSIHTSSFIFINALTNIQNEKKFQVSYLLALSEINMCASHQMLNHTVDYFNQIASFLLSDKNPNFFRVKMAAFLAIENLCNIPKFQQDNFDNLFALLFKELTTESNVILIELILRCFSSFLSKTKFNELNPNVTSLLSFLINLLMNSKNESVMSEAINTIRYLTASLSSSFIQIYPLLIKAINQINLTNQPDLIVPVIRLCDICVSSVNEIIHKDNNFELIEKVNKSDLLPLFLISIEMRGRVENESDFDYVSHAIISFINFFGKDAASILLSHVIPIFLPSASTEIEITHLPEGHGVVNIPGFVSVSPLDFAKVSTIRSILFSLKTLYDIISIVENGFYPFAKVVFQIASSWITYKFAISEISRLAWMILGKLNLLFANVLLSDGQRSEIDINVTFALFLNRPEIEIDSICSCQILMRSLCIGIERNSLNLQFLPKLLEAFTMSLRNKLQNFVDEQSDNSDDEEILENETKFFKFCLKKFPNISVPFYNQVVLPVIPELIKCPLFLDFVIKVTTCYIIISHDLSFFQNFENVLFGSLAEIDSEAAQIAMKSIGKFLSQKEFTFPTEFYILSYQKMSEFLNDQVSFENDSEILYNETIISFTKFLCYHSDVFKSEENGNGLKIALHLWFDSIPKILNNKKNSIAFNFLSFLISEKTAEMLEIFGPATLIKGLLKSIGNEAVSDENEQKFKSFIQNFISAKGNPFTTNDENQDNYISESDMLKLRKIMENK